VTIPNSKYKELLYTFEGMITNNFMEDSTNLMLGQSFMIAPLKLKCLKIKVLVLKTPTAIDIQKNNFIKT